MRVHVVGPSLLARHQRPAAVATPRGLDLLADNIAAGAKVVAIGAYANLALLAVTRPGALDGVPRRREGRLVHPPARGLPQWGPEMDWNVQGWRRPTWHVPDDDRHSNRLPLES